MVIQTKKTARKTKNKWEDDVKSDITRMKITNWKIVNIDVWEGSDVTVT